jgi:hypothetical protein
LAGSINDVVHIDGRAAYIAQNPVIRNTSVHNPLTDLEKMVLVPW